MTHAEVGVTVSGESLAGEFGEGVGAALRDRGEAAGVGIFVECVGDAGDGGHDSFAVVAG